MRRHKTPLFVLIGLLWLLAGCHRHPRQDPGELFTVYLTDYCRVWEKEKQKAMDTAFADGAKAMLRKVTADKDNWMCVRDLKMPSPGEPALLLDEEAYVGELLKEAGR